VGMYSYSVFGDFLARVGVGICAIPRPRIARGYSSVFHAGIPHDHMVFKGYCQYYCTQKSALITH